MLSLTSETIPSEELRQSMSTPGAGALAVFEGHVRDHNHDRQVLRLEYEGADELAQREFARILEEARHRFDFLHLRCVHRVGTLDIGDVAVWIGVAAEHRDAAFAACSFIIDELKHRLPIWKKEHYADGDSGWLNTP